MILTCPSCATRYLVDPVAIGRTGRQVRCARCGHSWRQSAVADEVVETSEAVAEEQANRQRQERRERQQQVQEATTAARARVPALPQPRRRLPPWAGWVALFVLLAGIGVAAGLFRSQVQDLWPASSRIYDLADGLGASLGFDSAPAEAPVMLTIRNLRSEREAREGDTILKIMGEVINHGQAAQAVPPLRLALTDAQGREIYQWTVALGQDNLAPGAVVAFSTQLANPPDDARNLAVSFGGG